MTINDSVAHFIGKLKENFDSGEARQITEMVLEKATGMSRLDRLMHPDKILLSEQEKELQRMLNLLTDHTPVQYVLEEAWFYKMPFYVDSNVLIPRPETEELIEWVLKDTAHNESGCKVLDIGTGSGCIAIALKKNNPALQVFALDKYEAALTVARKNAKALDAEITFMEADILTEEGCNQLPEMDIIVSNPPYIPLNEKAKMDTHVTSQEPGGALFVPDEDPLVFYKSILSLSLKKLKPGGRIYVEIHEDHGLEVKQLFEEALSDVRIKKDVYGKDRMVAGKRPE